MTNLYCYFCNQLMEHSPESTPILITCLNHPIKVCHFYGNKKTLSFVEMSVEINDKQYFFSVDADDSATIKNGMAEIGLVDVKGYHKIHQFPFNEDVTPENCQQYVERILNLKAFL